VKGLIAGEDGTARAIFDGFGEDAIAVIVVKDQQIVIAMAGWCDEAACLVSVDLAGGFHEGSVAEVGAFIGLGAQGIGIIGRIIGDGC
jgi:hypothetical protein